MSALLKQTGGDLQQAARLASAELDTLKRRSDSIAGAIANMRAAAASGGLRPSGGGDDPLARAILQHDPFQQDVLVGIRQNARDKIPAIASPAAAAGITRTQAAMFSLLFTLGNLGEQLATADTKWQKLDRTIGTALQTVGAFGLASGTVPGLIIAGVATLGNFLSSFWTQQREEAERTAKSVEESINRIVDSRDTMAQMKRAQELFAGTPSSGYRGIAQLQREQADLFAQIDFAKVYHPKDLHDLTRELGEVNDLLVPMENEFQTLKRAIEDVNNTPLEIKGLPGRTTTARATPTGEQSIQQDVARATELLALQKLLTESHRDTAGVVGQLAIVYDRLNASLDLMGEKWSTQAIQVQQIIEAIDRSPLDDLLRTGVPRGRVTGAIAPLAPVRMEIPALNVLPVTLGERIQLALQPLVDAVSKMGGYLLQAGLGMLQRYGGPMGNAAAGVIGGGVAGYQMAGAAGAAIGSVVGLAEGILSLGESSRAAHEQLRALQQQTLQFVESLQLQLGDITQLTYDTNRLHEQVEALRRPWEDRIRALQRERAEAQRMGAPQDILDEFNRQIREAQFEIDRLNDLEKRHTEQLGDQADALNQMTEAAEQFRNVPSWFKVSLAAWRAAHPAEVQLGEQLMHPSGTIPAASRAGGAGATTTTFVLQTAAINVSTRAASARELYDDLMAETKRRGRATFGMGAESRVLDTP